MRNKIFILLAICLALSSCATPSKEIPTESYIPPTATIAPTALPTTEPIATAIIPLTLEQIEEKLEAELGSNVWYFTILSVGHYIDYYVFNSSKGQYHVDKITGNIISYNYIYSKSDPEELLNEEDAKQVAIDELKKHCPEFFDYDYEFKMHKPNNAEFGFHFQQLSKKGRYTGNSLDANVVYDGTIKSFSIWYNENPLAVDADYLISEQQAIEIAYEASKSYLADVFSEEGYIVDTDLNDRESHEVEVSISCFYGTQQLIIEIHNVSIKATSPDKNTNTSVVHFTIVINANTGELCATAYDLDSIISVEQ